MDNIEDLLVDIQSKLTLEGKKRVFEENKELKSSDLKAWQDPEEFTREYLIDKILFNILKVSRTAPKNFETTDGTPRKVDYAIKYNENRMLIEAKPINANLYKKSSQGAVNQVIGIFKLAEAKEKYDFGIATDGLHWVFINKKGKIYDELDIQKDFDKIKRYIVGIEKVRDKKLEDISKRFYEEYNDILHGTKKISKKDCLVNSILNVENEEDREEIAQVIIDRLIFIKFLQSKGIIKDDILDYLYHLEEYELNLKLKQLFFEVMNTKEKERGIVDPHFEYIPYLNGSLFERFNVEKRNPDYRIKPSILRRIIEFLNKFRFIHTESLERNGEVINPEILGYIFERAMTSQDRKGTGAYYTPTEITEYIAKNTIYPMVLDKCNNLLHKDKGYKKTELLKNIEELFILPATTLNEIWTKIILNLKICDNACGSGAFLLAVANILFDINKRINDRLGLRNTDIALKKLVLKSIYGVDINPRAIEIARLRLWLWLVESYKPDFIEPLPNIEYNLRVGNTLIGYVDIEQFGTKKISLDDFNELEESPKILFKKFRELKNNYQKAFGDEAKKLKVEIEKIREKINKRLDIEIYREIKTNNPEFNKEYLSDLKPFHWGFEFYEVFDLDRPKKERGFDIIVGNPPYFNLQTVRGREKKKIFEENYFSYRGKADILYLFIERAIKILRYGGHLGFIVANYFLRSHYADKLRKLIVDKCYILKIVDFGSVKIFQDANVDTSIIILKRSNQKNKKMMYGLLKSENKIKDYLNDTLKTREKDTANYLILFDNQTNKGYEPWKFGEKEFKDTIPLKRICYIGKGAATGRDDIFVIDKKKAEELHLEPEILDSVVEDSSIDRYHFKLSSKVLIRTKRGCNIEKYPNTRRYLEEHKKEIASRYAVRKEGIKWFEIVRYNTDLFSEDVGEQIYAYYRSPYNKFAYSDNRYVTLTTTFVLTKKYSQSISLKYILGILNSNLIQDYTRRNAKKMGNCYEYSSNFIGSIPIKIVSEEERKRIIKLVDKMLSLNKRLNEIGDKKTDERARIEEEIKKTDAEIDEFVYKIYGITEKEKKIIEESI